MFGFIKQVFTALLSFSRLLDSIVKVSGCTWFMFFNNQPCMTRPILVESNPEFSYYPFMGSLVIS